MKKCNVCQELKLGPMYGCDPRYQAVVDSRKNIIYESADFVVLPSLGPLNDSHVMIVPKTHINNFSMIPDSTLSQVRSIAQALSSYVERKHGKRLAFFESGAGAQISHSGGCIVHAHIHCVYEHDEFEQRLFEELDFQEGGVNWYSNADGNLGYVWFMNSRGEAFLSNNPQLPSQFLRYLYSMSAGDIRYWNWRRHNNYEGVVRVLKSYEGFQAYTEEQRITLE